MRKTRQYKPYEDYYKSAEFKKIDRQRWRNNILGLIILILITLLAVDVGGCLDWLGGIVAK